MRIITVLTDFGLDDHYVAAMKGVMLGINPMLQIVDITHTIPQGDIRSGAFILGQVWSSFPAGTIHLGVVDPGVGTARKAIAVSAGRHIFVAPDNGLLSWVYASGEEPEIFEITAVHYFRHPVSSTFHGRDVFAPVAAWLTRDVPFRQLGPPVARPVRLEIPAPRRVRDGLIEATVLAVDRFGNLITNLRPQDLPVYSKAGGPPCKLLAAHREITSFRSTFGEGHPGELFVLPGSSGYLEIVRRDGSAAAELNLKSAGIFGVVIG